MTTVILRLFGETIVREFPTFDEARAFAWANRDAVVEWGGRA